MIQYTPTSKELKHIDLEQIIFCRLMHSDDLISLEALSSPYEHENSILLTDDLWRLSVIYLERFNPNSMHLLYEILKYNQEKGEMCCPSERRKEHFMILFDFQLVEKLVRDFEYLQEISNFVEVKIDKSVLKRRIGDVS